MSDQIRELNPPESSLSPADHLLRGAWTVLALAWSIVCVVQAVDRLDDLARGTIYSCELAASETVYWLRPMLALALGGFVVVFFWSRGRLPALKWRNVITPAIATRAAIFAWMAVLLAVRLVERCG